MPRIPRSLFDALADTPATASLLARVTASERAARAIAGTACVPGFDPLEPGRCELRDRTLHLRAPSPAIASKLRQSLPSLLGVLQRQGVEVNEIRVRVQPEQPGYLVHGSSEAHSAARTDQGDLIPSASLSISGARAFAEKLALTLTNSPLKTAAEKLSQRLKRVT